MKSIQSVSTANESAHAADGTITVLGGTVGRDPVTGYLAAMRRAGIGEATLLQFADDDSRFHLVVAPFAAPAAATEVTAPSASAP